MYAMLRQIFNDIKILKFFTVTSVFFLNKSLFSSHFSVFFFFLFVCLFVCFSCNWNTSGEAILPFLLLLLLLLLILLLSLLLLLLLWKGFLFQQSTQKVKIVSSFQQMAGIETIDVSMYT